MSGPYTMREGKTMAKKKQSTAAFLKSFLECEPALQGIKQAFVIAALDIYVKECMNNVKDNNPMSGFVTDELWHDIAQELNVKLDKQFAA